MGGFPQLNRFVAGLFKLVFPPACPLCLQTLPQGSALTFCATCLASTKPLSGACCSLCSLPFPASENSSHLCGRCLSKTPPYRRVFAYGHYDGMLRKAIHQFKFNGKVGIDRYLAGLIDQCLTPDLEIDLVVPVPLHVSSLKKRGYNQALLLARELSRLRPWRVETKLLKKTISTPPQHDLSAEQRARNLRGAFEVVRPLAGETVLLVDDVMTTGATVDVCSSALLQAGARDVFVVVVARAGR